MVHDLNSNSYDFVVLKHLFTGALDVNGTVLKHGDGAAVSNASELRFKATKPSDVLIFDLA